MGKKLRVGLDFDGVIAYNPARIIRPCVKWFKSKLLGKRKLSFLVPKSPLMKIIWLLLHESSIFPAQGVELLKQQAGNRQIEFYLITGRFPLLEPNLRKWLHRNHLENIFHSVIINRAIEQPHEFKLRVINELQLDYYVEDNWDIIDYLKNKTQARVLWIYNLLDRNQVYPDKFPYLEKALEKILE